MLNPPKNQQNQTGNCNCRTRVTCPLDGKCLVKSLIYQGTLNCEENEALKFKYIGLAEGDFKSRYNNHNTSFRDRKYEKSTELSKKYWSLKSEGKKPKVAWEILRVVNSYKIGQKHCNLCLTEKLLIIKCRDTNLLNSRSEISAKCRHKRKFLLNQV